MAHSLAHAVVAEVFAALDRHPNLVQRQRIWTARALLVGLLTLIAGRSSTSTAGMLRSMIGSWDSDGDWESIPSRSGFCQARDRLPASTIRQVWQDAQSVLRSLVPAETQVFGLRPIAVDGTWVLTPHEASTKTRFGQPTGGVRGGKMHNPQALLVTAVEITSKIPIDAELLPWDGAEHAGLRRLLPSLGAGTIAVMDRGFVGKRLLGEVIATGGHAVVRMGVAEANSWDCVYHFLRSKALDTVVELEVPMPSGEKRVVPIRLIRRSFRRGRPCTGQKAETMVLLTTLTDAAIASRDELIDLYCQRWSIETRYRELKTIIKLEAFRSRKADRIDQEIQAALLWMTMVAALELESDRVMTARRGIQRWNDPTRWQISRALLLELADGLLVAMLRDDIDDAHLVRLITKNSEYLVRLAQRRRPGRSCPRKRLSPTGRFRANG